MRFVIYDDATLEPITVVAVPGFGERDIERMGGRLRLAAQPPIGPRADPPATLRMDVVDLWFERFLRHPARGGRQMTWMCFTKQTELAMLLDPDWLPGQRSTINDMERHTRLLTEFILRAIA